MLCKARDKKTREVTVIWTGIGAAIRCKFGKREYPLPIGGSEVCLLTIIHPAARDLMAPDALTSVDARRFTANT
jgi:hypothetical protein